MGLFLWREADLKGQWFDEIETIIPNKSTQTTLQVE